VQRHGNGPHFYRAQQTDVKLRSGRHEKSHPLSLPDAHIFKHVGKSIGQAFQIPISIYFPAGAVVKDKGRPVPFFSPDVAVNTGISDIDLVVMSPAEFFFCVIPVESSVRQGIIGEVVSITRVCALWKFFFHPVFLLRRDFKGILIGFAFNGPASFTFIQERAISPVYHRAVPCGIPIA